jgi:hypothetical protein
MGRILRFQIRETQGYPRALYLLKWRKRHPRDRGRVDLVLPDSLQKTFGQVERKQTKAFGKPLQDAVSAPWTEYDSPPPSAVPVYIVNTGGALQAQWGTQGEPPPPGVKDTVWLPVGVGLQTLLSQPLKSADIQALLCHLILVSWQRRQMQAV